MELEAAKREFALSLVRDPSDAYGAALRIYPDQIKAAQIASQWTRDPEILALVEDLRDSVDPLDFLPGEAEYLSLIWSIATNERVDVETRLKAADQYAETRGYKKNKAPSGTTVNVTSGVMVIKDNGSPEQWEEKLKQQQSALVNDVVTQH